MIAVAYVGSICLTSISASADRVEDLSQFSGRFEGKPNQREVLFDCGCEFRFNKVESEEGAYVFYLTEV